MVVSATPRPRPRSKRGRPTRSPGAFLPLVRGDQPGGGQLAQDAPRRAEIVDAAGQRADTPQDVPMRFIPWRPFISFFRVTLILGFYHSRWRFYYAGAQPTIRLLARERIGQRLHQRQ